MSVQLGRLQRIDLRQAWQSEDGDFTTWLAQPENLALLGETIGLDLELQGTEQGVGPFRADILCKDTLGDQWVVVENQLERTDHGHLGQLLTYAAGLEAVTIVWIAGRFTDEHRAALDWLNEVTNERANFFGLEVELWRIGDSVPAPKFNVVSQPNESTKGPASPRSSDTLTPAAQLRLEYWSALREVIEADPGPLKATKPSGQSWYGFAIGRSYFTLYAAAYGSEQSVNVDLNIYGPDRIAHFNLLLAQKGETETQLGEALEWLELPNMRISRIILRRPADVEDRDDWPAQHQWLREKLKAFHRVFTPRIRVLDASEYDAGGDVDAIPTADQV